MKAQVTVTLKPGVLDPAGQAVLGGLHALGYPEVRGVRIGKFFEIDLESTPDSDVRLARMCDQLLANPVIEDFRIEVIS